MGYEYALLYNVIRSKSYYQFINAKSSLHNKCIYNIRSMVTIISTLIILVDGYNARMPKQLLFCFAIVATNLFSWRISTCKSELSRISETIVSLNGGFHPTTSFMHFSLSFQFIISSNFNIFRWNLLYFLGLGRQYDSLAFTAAMHIPWQIFDRILDITRVFIDECTENCSKLLFSNTKCCTTYNVS